MGCFLILCVCCFSPLHLWSVVFSEFAKIWLLLETYRRHMGDRHAWSETYWRLICLTRDLNPFIGDKSKTDMPIEDRHAWSDTDMPQQTRSETHWRPIKDQLKTHRRPSCLIKDPLEIYRRPFGIPSETSKYFIGDPSETNIPQYIIPIYINMQKVTPFWFKSTE